MRARSASSELSVDPTRRMSIASCFELSNRLFCIVRAADLAPSISLKQQQESNLKIFI